jgi:hypothetical protein
MSNEVSFFIFILWAAKSIYKSGRTKSPLLAHKKSNKNHWWCVLAPAWKLLKVFGKYLINKNKNLALRNAREFRLELRPSFPSSTWRREFWDFRLFPGPCQLPASSTTVVFFHSAQIIDWKKNFGAHCCDVPHPPCFANDLPSNIKIPTKKCLSKYSWWWFTCNISTGRTVCNLFNMPNIPSSCHISNK